MKRTFASFATIAFIGGMSVGCGSDSSTSKDAAPNRLDAGSAVDQRLPSDSFAEHATVDAYLSQDTAAIPIVDGGASDIGAAVDEDVAATPIVDGGVPDAAWVNDTVPQAADGPALAQDAAIAAFDTVPNIADAPLGEDVHDTASATAVDATGDANAISSLDASSEGGAALSADASLGCVPFAFNAESVHVTCSSASLPSLTGGAVSDGTYYQTAHVKSATSSCNPATTEARMLVVHGNSAELAVLASNGKVDYYGAEFAVMGANQIGFRIVCSLVNSGTAEWTVGQEAALKYSSISGQYTFGVDNSSGVVVMTKQ